VARLQARTRTGADAGTSRSGCGSGAGTGGGVQELAQLQELARRREKGEQRGGACSTARLRQAQVWQQRRRSSEERTCVRQKHAQGSRGRAVAEKGGRELARS
jgi:hypothetical protein